MNEKLRLLLELRGLLTEQVELVRKELRRHELTPQEVADYNERSKKIRELTERLGEFYWNMA